jgi:hypothetical protein
MRIARIVVGNGDSAHSARSGGGDQLLRAAGGIAGKEGMDVKIKSMNHWTSLFRFDELTI